MIAKRLKSPIEYYAYFGLTPKIADFIETNKDLLQHNLSDCLKGRTLEDLKPVLLGGAFPAGLVILVEHFAHIEATDKVSRLVAVGHAMRGNVEFIDVTTRKRYSDHLGADFAQYVDLLHLTYGEGVEPPFYIPDPFEPEYMTKEEVADTLARSQAIFEPIFDKWCEYDTFDPNRPKIESLEGWDEHERLRTLHKAMKFRNYMTGRD